MLIKFNICVLKINKHLMKVHKKFLKICRKDKLLLVTLKVLRIVTEKSAKINNRRKKKHEFNLIYISLI